MHKQTATKTLLAIVALASLSFVGRGFTSNSSPTHFSAEPPQGSLPQSVEYLEGFAQPDLSQSKELITYYIVDDTCPAGCEAVEIKCRVARRTIQLSDVEQRAQLLAGVNRVLHDRLANSVTSK